MHFIVQSGMTRRLVEADDIEDARIEFLKARAMWRHVAPDEVIDIWPATDIEIADFRKRRRAQYEGQEVLELNDLRAGYGESDHS